ncbi:MAG: rRNA maturation RNase YbeY [Bdellovibrionales bacterium]|nr:rRNA maturation RNase YbeY [Bdellovibrionales bacterium]
MKLHIIRKQDSLQSSERIPASFLKTWTTATAKELKRRGLKDSKLNLDLNLVFVSAPEMKRLNRQFRGKNYATDVLSFTAIEPGVLGELVLCTSVLRRQALDHGLSFREELGYMVLHGLLHLLGYDHEQSEREAKKMFGLQDQVFEHLLKKKTSKAKKR